GRHPQAAPGAAVGESVIENGGAGAAVLQAQQPGVGVRAGHRVVGNDVAGRGARGVGPIQEDAEGVVVAVDVVVADDRILQAVAGDGPASGADVGVQKIAFDQSAADDARPGHLGGAVEVDGAGAATADVVTPHDIASSIHDADAGSGHGAKLKVLNRHVVGPDQVDAVAGGRHRTVDGHGPDGLESNGGCRRAAGRQAEA